MTSKMSLFNKGIYKSTVKRFAWGSVLYFIILFVLTSFVILMGIDVEDSYMKMASNGGTPMLYQQTYILPSLFAGMAVPTVVALMLFRFVHSKRQAVFIHGLPVCRTAGYISTLSAAFTLMFAPVVLNTIVLAVMSLTRYGEFFTVGSCFVWMGLNMLDLFVMFSVATLAAMLTGNSFAMVAINGILHCFLLIIAAGFGQLANLFLYGYAGNNRILQFLAERCFPIAVTDAVKSAPQIFEDSRLMFCTVLSLVLYAAAYVLYRLRRLETAEDVAAFKCLNPTFKYLLTFLASIGVFAMFSELLGTKPYLVIVLTAIVAVVAYFASEMVLKKTLRVWKSYKGCLGFAAVFAVILCTFAYTGFFGYETRVPDTKDVAKAGIGFVRDGKALVADDELIEYFTEQHKKLTEDRTVLNRYYLGDDESDCRFYITYELKNGKTLKRRYDVKERTYAVLADRAYENTEFKKLTEELYRDDIDQITHASLWLSDRVSDYTDSEIVITDSTKLEELFKAVEADTEELGYSDMNYTNRCMKLYVNFEYAVKPSENGEVNGETVMKTADREYLQYPEDMRRYSSIQLSIKPNYKNTLKWLEDNGYGDIMTFDERYSYYISHTPKSVNDWEENVRSDKQYELNSEEFAKIKAEDVKNLAKFGWSNVVRHAESDDAEIYRVYAASDADVTVYAGEDPLFDIYPEDLPEFLKQYTAE